MTNINITSNEKTFAYVIDYVRDISSFEKEFNYISKDKRIDFKSDLCRTGNEWWTDIRDYNKSLISKAFGTIRLYFPQYSIETYQGYMKYALDIYMFISDTKVNLGSYLINRFDALAAPSIIKFQGQEYYECIDLEIPDPYEILYGDAFEEFRKSIKGEDDNYDGTSLHISLHPVTFESGLCIIDSNYNGGQNSIMISRELSDYLNYTIKFDKENNNIIGKVSYNDCYDNLQEYLRETYALNGEVQVSYMLAMDKISPSVLESTTNLDSHIFELSELKNNFSCIIPLGNRYKRVDFFDNWELWEEGINIMSTAVIYVNEEEKLILKSNTIPLTQELYGKVKANTSIKINLEEMNVNKINIINSVNVESTKYNVPETSKSNIILPVFYRVRELGNVVVHPEVNENICINLDAYKSKVSNFIMQLEGIKFTEIGTTNSGTIFKVIGSMLPKSQPSGTYYILSQDGELVTTGKYTYEY